VPLIGIPSTKWQESASLQIRKATFEPIAAPENETFVGCVDLSISKQKQLVGADFGFS
jgi:hypothetical protein